MTMASMVPVTSIDDLCTTAASVYLGTGMRRHDLFGSEPIGEATVQFPARHVKRGVTGSLTLRMCGEGTSISLLATHDF